MAEPSWYHKKKYAHFDLPLSADLAALYVASLDNISQHSFYPFLAFDIKKRRYRTTGKKGIGTKKIRPIRMSAHLDGYIFAYYASVLSTKLEDAIGGTPVSQSILAYRKGLGSNIDFARDAFDEVDRRGDCVSIAFDLEKFFDTIDHESLKKQWCTVLGVPRLPKDHYAIYRAMTRYAWVDRDACYGALGIGDKDLPPRPLCTPEDFRTRIRGGGHIQVNSCPYGIPQGSPISAVLSNIFMLSFDKEMVDLAQKMKGYYRRYCDDILWIVDIGDERDVQNAICKSLAALIHQTAGCGALLHFLESRRASP